MEWCSENAHLFRNKNVLELGSGLGLMGLAVIKLCKPASYTFTDLPTTVLKTLAENVKINLENGPDEEISSICDWVGTYKSCIRLMVNEYCITIKIYAQNFSCSRK